MIRLKLPSLALARKIVRNYERDDFSLIIIHGNLRIGKSTYAIKSMEQALQYLGLLKGKMTPEVLKWIMGWETEEVVDTWMMVEERQPGYIWDDAGYWLHSMNWNDPLMITVQQYFNVVGTDYNTIMLTTPSPKWVLSKIANMPEMYRIKITKRTGGQGDSDFIKFARKARGYQKWESPDLKKGGVNIKLRDNFSCKMEADLYAWYKPVRDNYAKRAKLAIIEQLRKQRERDELQELKEARQRKRILKELYKNDGGVVTVIDKDSD